MLGYKHSNYQKIKNITDIILKKNKVITAINKQS